jgi:hypothetical protein
MLDRTYDYYFFTEDDYVYVKDDFDKIMIDLFNETPRCGYLCTLAKISPPVKMHAAISNGMSSRIVLDAVYQKFGKLKHYEGDNHAEDYAGEGQVIFSRAFLEAGFVLADIRGKYRAPYWETGYKTVTEYAPQNTEYLIQPVQML